MGLDQVYNTGRSVYHSLCALEDTFSTASRLAFNDLQDETVSDMTLRQRLPYWRRGFKSRAEVLYDLDEYDLEDYLSDYDKAMWASNINGRALSYTLNKLAFYHLLQAMHGDAVPEVYGVIEDGHVYSTAGEQISDNPIRWFVEQLQSVDRVICKPPEGWGGQDIKLLDRVEKAETFCRRLSDSSRYLVMEYVEQAEYIDQIYSDSANTIRAITMWDYEKNEPFLARVVHRIGTDTSAPTDNWNQGGISANIDVKSGRLTAAATLTPEYYLQRIDTHPDTDVQIVGTEIPNWDQTKEKIRAMAAQLRYLPLLGWDIIISDDGVEVLEANSVPGVVTLQVHEPLLTDPRIRQFFEKHGVV